MQIINKKVNELIPYENNPRINDQSVDAVANSIEEFGFKVPLVIDKNNVIITGHTRLKAAKKLGIEEVPCILADDLNDEQIKAFRIADNKVGESSEWDFSKLKKELDKIKSIDMSDFGLSMDDINKNLFSSSNLSTSVIKKAEKDADIKHNSKITLYNGDCLVEMKKIPDKSVNFILTDLPYGTTDCKWDSIIPFDKLWEEWKRVLKENGTVALFGDNEVFEAQIINSNINNFKYNWIWKKPYGTGFLSAKSQPLRDTESISIFQFFDNYKNSRVHKEKIKYMNEELKKSKKSITEINKHFKAVNVHWFRECQFSIISENDYKELQKWTGCFTKSYEEFLSLDNDTDFIYNPQMSEGKPYTQRRGADHLEIYDSPSGALTINEETRYPKQILEFDYDTNNGLHPTQKPIELLKYLIRTYTNEGMLVLDSTMGSGSTGAACKELGRDFIGIELDKKYFNIAKERIG